MPTELEELVGFLKPGGNAEVRYSYRVRELRDSILWRLFEC